MEHPTECEHCKEINRKTMQENIDRWFKSVRPATKKDYEAMGIAHLYSKKKKKK